MKWKSRLDLEKHGGLLFKPPELLALALP